MSNREIAVFMLFALLVFTSDAAQFVVTNDTLSINCEARTMEVRGGDKFKYTLYARTTIGTPESLANRIVRGSVIDVSDGYADTQKVVSAELVSDTNGVARFETTMSGLEDGNYLWRVGVWQTNGTYVKEIACDRLVIWSGCDTCSVSSGSGSVSITLTSPPPQITLVTTQIYPTTYISTSAGVFRVTSTNGTVTVNTNDEGTVDLGVVPAQDVALTASTNGVTLGTFDTLNTGPGILGELSTSGVFTLSLEAYQWPGAAAGTNRQAFPYVANTSQWWQVPSGVTSIYVWVWGGGSVGGTVAPAGFTAAEVPVQPLEWLELQVGQGGQCVTCYTAAVQTDSAWPNGGRGVCRLGTGSGGYSTGGGAWGAVLRTGMVLVAAGGASGTGQGSSVVYAGGGRVGRGRGNVGDATGGTQTNGGLAATASGVVLITNGAGQFMMGGQGGMVTNLGHGAGGGGGGYFGGGGGFSDQSTLRAAAGGSGFVNAEQGCVGETYPAYTGTYPVGFDLPEYALAGTPGYTSTSTSMGSRGGNAGIVIGWQAPP